IQMCESDSDSEPLNKQTAPKLLLAYIDVNLVLAEVLQAGLKHLKLERVKKFEYCLPYFYHPFREDETEQSTVVDIMFPAEPPVVCEFDWEMDELEEFTNELIASEELTEDQKDEFKEFVKEKVREAKRANREAREKRKKAREEMDQNAVAAFENMKFYKFYPVATPDTPDALEDPVNAGDVRFDVLDAFSGLTL
ncbi:heat intolerant 4-like protein, partial [Tanacetum coccineum]